jgi:hypothetical protein
MSRCNSKKNEEERNCPLHGLLSISATHVVENMILRCNKRYAYPELS